MERVASFVKTYLLPSETFIYEEIRNLRSFEALILTKKVKNLELFPPRFEIFQEPAGLSQRWRDFFGGLLLIDFLDQNFFKQILIAHRARLIHAHFAYGGMMALPLSRELGLPLVTTLHGIDVSRLIRHPVYRYRLSRLLEQGNLFLTQSRSMKEDIERLGCPKERVITHPSGVDIENFRPTKITQGQGTRILMCGRFEEKKGFEYGLRAFARLSKEYRNIKLIIIGYGRLEKKLKRVAKALDIEEKSSFLGPLSHDRVAGEFGKADIFLSPNVTSRNGDKEGMPNVIKEAMATGLPVVSTHHAGIPELVEEGKSGFLVSERDVKGLAERLDHLINHTQICKQMGAAAREVVAERFNLKKQVQILEGYYQKLTHG